MTDKNLLSQSDALLLLREAILRLKKRSPKFFRVFTNVNYVIALIGIIPTILTWFGIILPPNWAVVLLKVVSAAGAWGALMSSLAVSEPKSEVMPFTEKKHIEQQIQQDFEQQSKVQ